MWRFSDTILVAGGGFRHHLVGRESDSLIQTANKYDAVTDGWVAMEDLPQIRAGSVRYFVGMIEFWVMGGYGGFRDVPGLFLDEYYNDDVVLNLEDGHWRELGEMWP